MYLDYAKMTSGRDGQPILRLRTLAGNELGPIPYVYGLRFTINYSDVSEIEFTTPYMVDGNVNPLYDAITSFKVVYTEDFGIYVLASPKKTGDGVEETKTVTGYSLEQLFRKKSLFLEEGTYNFWNPVDSADTVLGRVLELDPGWSAGYVAPRLIGCYRTFDQYDSDALGFCYGDAAEKYRCAFVFDVYKKTVNVYDATEDAAALPIYLSFDNLVEDADVEELADDVATRLHLSGSDNLTIRDVNPTGKDYLVNLDYFLSNGDLDVKVGTSDRTLADRVREWQTAIAARQTYYIGLVSARASLTAQKLAAGAELTEMEGELDSLLAQQSVIIQAMAMEMDEAGKTTQQKNLDEVNAKIQAQREKIAAKEQAVAALEQQIQEYMDAMTAVNRELAYEGYFTEDERNILNNYMIDADVSDETFVASDVDQTNSGAVSKLSGAVALEQSDLTKIELSDLGKTMYVFAGGALSAPGQGVQAEIVRGTLEVRGTDGYVLTAYLGKTEYGGHAFPTGLLTAAGTMTGWSTDTAEREQDGITEYRGTAFRFETADADAYFTVGASEYKSYSVALELYDFGQTVLDDYAWPVYEFNINCANFLFHEKFEPFQNKLELGKAIHLNLGSEGHLNAKIIGVELDFDDPSEIALVFSNRYQKKNGRKILKDILTGATSSKRSIDAGKYVYNRAADKVTEVTEVMDQQLVAARNRIVNAADDQTVVISRAGINIGGESNYQMRLVDNMLAMTDDSWKTAKLAIGLFATEDVGETWGVNAEMLAGRLILGNKMVLQNPNDNGYMMFQVDESGAWLYNAQFVLQNGQTGGLIIMDPRYGIAAGTKLLFDTNGTTVTPEFLDAAGDIAFDAEGLPENANFYLDARDGSAYFRGRLVAKSGKIGGYTIEGGYLHSGSGKTYAALNGGTDVYADYALWAGGEDPTSPLCPFWVKKDGTLHAGSGDFTGAVHATSGEFSGTVNATDGIFKGTVQASRYLDTAGENMMDEGRFKSKYLKVDELNVADNFKVDKNGNVTMNGNITLGGNIAWNGNSPVKYQFSAYASGPWHDAMQSADKYRRDSLDGGATWGEAYQFRGTDGRNGADGSDAMVPRYIHETYIDSTTIKAPRIEANTFAVYPSSPSDYYGSFDIYGQAWASGVSNQFHMFSISYVGEYDTPQVILSSPSGADIYFGDRVYGDKIFFKGTVDFSGATVTGLTTA